MRKLLTLLPLLIPLWLFAQFSVTGSGTGTVTYTITNANDGVTIIENAENKLAIDTSLIPTIEALPTILNVTSSLTSGALSFYPFDVNDLTGTIADFTVPSPLTSTGTVDITAGITNTEIGFSFDNLEDSLNAREQLTGSAITNGSLSVVDMEGVIGSFTVPSPLTSTGDVDISAGETNTEIGFSFTALEDSINSRAVIQDSILARDLIVTGGWEFGNITSTGTIHADDGLTTFGQIVNSGLQTKTLGVGITTFAVTSNVVKVTADEGGNTIASITGASGLGIYVFIFTDALVIITDNNSHSDDSVDLSAAFTSADDTTLTLVFDGVSWYELSRSVN